MLVNRYGIESSSHLCAPIPCHIAGREGGVVDGDTVGFSSEAVYENIVERSLSGTGVAGVLYSGGESSLQATETNLPS